MLWEVEHLCIANTGAWPVWRHPNKSEHCEDHSMAINHTCEKSLIDQQAGSNTEPHLRVTVGTQCLHLHSCPRCCFRKIIEINLLFALWLSLWWLQQPACVSSHKSQYYYHRRQLLILGHSFERPEKRKTLQQEGAGWKMSKCSLPEHIRLHFQEQMYTLLSVLTSTDFSHLYFSMQH